MTEHNPEAPGCIELVPGVDWRIGVRCPACDELHTLMHLDPDVTEVLTREPWCAYCLAGDKKPISNGRQMTLCLICHRVNKEFDAECGHDDAQTPIPDDRYDANGEPWVDKDAEPHDSEAQA
jgi:hypothetical protein